MDNDQDEEEEDIEDSKQDGFKRLSKTDRLKRDRDCIRLRLYEGKSYEEIAELVSPPFANESGPRKVVTKWLESQIIEDIAPKKVEHRLRLEALIDVLFPEAMGSLDAILDRIDLEGEHADRAIAAAFQSRNGTVDRVIKLSESLRKLDGMDAPTKQEVTGSGGAPFEVFLNWPMPDPNTEVIPQDQLGNQT